MWKIKRKENVCDCAIYRKKSGQLYRKHTCENIKGGKENE